MGELLMDHNDIRHALSEYLDGSLAPADQSIVEEHLKTCTSCTDALAELRKTIEQVKSLDQVEPPAWMTQKIMARVREEDAKKKSVWRYWFFPFRFPIETVGVVLLAVTAFFIYKNTQPVDRFAEQPTVQTEAPAPAPAMKKEPAKENAVPGPRAVPQAPGYKALDMKQEYESPPPPVPETASAPPAEKLAAGLTPEKKEGAAMVESRSAVVQERSEGFAPTGDTKIKQAGPVPEGYAVQGGAKQFNCLQYGPKVVELSGTIHEQDFPGPPNYESIAAGDARESSWILHLDKVICVSGDPNDVLNQAEENIGEIQLVIASEQYKKYKMLLLKPATVRGTIFHSHTGHHHTRILLNLEQILPR